MWYRNFVIVICSLLWLPSCGFEPLYGYHKGAVVQDFANIKVKVISERTGQQLRNLLLTKLTPHGQPDRPLYELQITLDSRKYELGILKDATASRAQIRTIAKYTLIELKKRTTVCQGQVEGVSEFNILADAAFATLAAEKNANEVVLEDIADSIRRRIAACFSLNQNAN